MQKLFTLLVPLLCSLAAAAAPASQAVPDRTSEVAAAVDLADLAARQRGGRTQLVVLGTTHLRGAPDAIARQAIFDPLVA
ncbi:MAG TPA: hypothetical protein VGE47_16535, partial [Burkholderiaceae bacterium]